MTRLEPTPRRIFARRLLFAVLICATVLTVSWELLSMLLTNGMNGIKFASFVLFVVLLVPMTIGFWTSVFGFLVRVRGGDPLDVTRSLAEPVAADYDWPRNAVVVPAFNEDPARLLAGIKATYESLEQIGFLPFFDFFILSDTNHPDIWVREEMGFAALRQSVHDPARLFYRNRRENAERKTGNLADFCATWGDSYRYMVVFDADSVMTGGCLVNLVRLMERHPGVGIIQAPPWPVERRTLFGRLWQFSAHAYSSVFISGLNFWQGGEGNYWGHNAIIRIKPFVEHCHLPKLSGREPLGGSILSHDFIEAAYMRRAGWRVYLAAEMRGSYEELPSSFMSYAGRDRRWCQGNLQHARLLFTPGFHLINRLHLWLGVMAYLSSPLWILMLILSTIEGLREALGRHPYFPAHRALYPIWPVSVAQQAVLIFIQVMAILIVPKLLSLCVHLASRARRAAFGGGAHLTESVFIETLSSALMAPMLAMVQTHFVIRILLGQNVKWDAQDRHEIATTYAEAARRLWLGTLLGLGWSALLLATVPRLFWWFSPVLAGFVLSIPFAVWTSRVTVGEWARKHGWFLTPEEVTPPTVLKHLHEELAAADRNPWARDSDGLALVLSDPDVRALHLALLPPAPPLNALQRHYLKGLQIKLREAGIAALALNEKRTLLLDADSIRLLAEDAHDRASSEPFPARPGRLYERASHSGQSSS